MGRTGRPAASKGLVRGRTDVPRVLWRKTVRLTRRAGMRRIGRYAGVSCRVPRGPRDCPRLGEVAGMARVRMPVACGSGARAFGRSAGVPGRIPRGPRACPRLVEGAEVARERKSVV